jgi:hypothetical protein
MLDPPQPSEAAGRARFVDLGRHKRLGDAAILSAGRLPDLPLRFIVELVFE